MGYEIEMSLNLKKQSSNVTKLINETFELANLNDCDYHYQFSECEGEVRRLKRKSQVMVFCFDEEKFEKMTNFLKEIIDNYRKCIYVESVYDVNKHSLIYASRYYMKLMESDSKDDYKERRSNRSFSETDYFIIRDILKKNY